MQLNVELTQDAYIHWLNAEYKQCVASLRQINPDLSSKDLEENGNGVVNAKIEHNISLAEFVAAHTNTTPKEETLERMAKTFAEVSRRIDEVCSFYLISCS